MKTLSSDTTLYQDITSPIRAIGSASRSLELQAEKLEAMSFLSNIQWFADNEQALVKGIGSKAKVISALRAAQAK